SGPFALAPLPEWIVDSYWGEEFRGLKLDTPEAVAAAKAFLCNAPRPKDLAFSCYGKPQERPSKREVAEAERILANPGTQESYREEARKTIERAEAARDTDQLYDICKEVFALGISEARARVLIDLYWNEPGNPPYPTETVNSALEYIWRPDPEDAGDSSLN